jgi:deazaflavin-dependent oxidoreductase (nitroreductase family)
LLAEVISWFDIVAVQEVNDNLAGLCAVMAELEHGLWPRTQALIETTGRTSGLPRRVPVGNELRGDSFWIVTEHGYAADYVKNIQRQPRMRVKAGRQWRDGTAQILPDDDPLARLRWLRRPVNDAFLLLIGTQQLTIRVKLDA